MSDPWDPANDPGEADPEITSALRTMAPPAHGYGFWAMLDARLAAEGGTEAPPAPPPAPPEPPGPPPPPLAAVIPLSPRRGPGRWLLAVAAAVVALAGIAAVTRSDDTKLETTPAAPVVPVETTTPPPPTSEPPPERTSVSSTVPRPASTVPVAPGTSKPAASPTTVRPTTTTRSGSLTLSPAGLGPLRLGMSPQQAAATGAVGRYSDADPTSPRGCGLAPAAGSYRSGDFDGLFLDNKLARIYVTQSSRLSTPQGITVGSPSSMIASVPGTRSEQPHPYGAGTNIRVMTGGAGYLFTVSQGAITEWSVGTPAGLDLSEACS